MTSGDYDYVIIGGGIVGLAIAYQIKLISRGSSIAIIEKESEVAQHASGRNSGIIHAGFYYTADSLKAKLTRDGNKLLKKFCQQNKIFVANTEKIVVAQNSSELESLQTLLERGIANGVPVEIISENNARDIEPNIRTYKQALYSPSTASVNPREVCLKLKEILLAQGVAIFCNEKFSCLLDDETVITNKRKLKFNKVINAAGLYADSIATSMGFNHSYVVVPFKGLYLKYTGDSAIIKTNIYPVPDLNNPFLGVHFTKMYNGDVKIGPTAIPAFWRENYNKFDNFSFKEMYGVLKTEVSLAFNNNFNFIKLAHSEVKKYYKPHFIRQSRNLVMSIDNQFIKYPPGIRAQLFDLKQRSLVKDFLVCNYKNQVHILNAVSPAFTCAFSFADYVVERFINVRTIAHI